MNRLLVAALSLFCAFNVAAAGPTAKKKTWADIIYTGDPAEIERALDAGQDINGAFFDEDTAVMHFAENRNGDQKRLAVLSLLIKRHADLERGGKLHRTALLRAVDSDSLQAARLLLEAKANIGTADSNGTTLLIIAAGVHQNAAMVRLLLEYGADQDGRTSTGETPLQAAAEYGSTEAVKALLDAKPDLDHADILGRTPLHFAAMFDRPEAARFLLQAGFDPNRKDNQGTTAFSQAKGKTVALFRTWQSNGGHLPPAELPAAAPPALPKDELKRMVAEAVKEAAEVKPAPAGAPKSDVDTPGFKLKERTDDYAVVVGIERYSDLPPAQFAERDAQAVTNQLIALGVPSRNVVLLSGDKAGYKGIEKFVENWLPHNTDENSRVFFYFSGHGAPDVKTGLAYLVPWDGDANFLENTGYPVKRLYEKLGTLKAKQIVVALDACFSGAGGRSVLAKGARPLVTNVDQGGSAAGRLTVFAAAAGDQITSSMETEGHGTFTYYFLKGLGGGAKDASGRVTAQKLYDYLKPKVEDAARRQNRQQDPVLRTPSQDAELFRF